MSIILTVKESHETDRRIEASPVLERLVVLAKLEFSAFIFLLQLHPDKFKFMGNLEEFGSLPSVRKVIDKEIRIIIGQTS